MSAGDPLKPLEAQLAALLAPYKAEINEALAVRYLCLIGLSILVFDHCVTFSAERRLIWNAPRSIAKVGFLLNRYLVPLCLVGVFLALSGFYGLDLTDSACRNMFAVFSIIEMCSLALGNGLVAMRVVDIWDRDRRVAWIVFSGYAVAYTTAIACYTTTLITRLDSITWNPLVNMCNLSRSSYLVIPAWAAPLAFELMVLAALLWNNIDRPRGIDMKLAQALHEDGIMFYVIMTVLRFVELGLSATLNPRLLMLGAFFLWAMVTTTSSRSLLAWRRIEISESSFLPGGSSRNMHVRRGTPSDRQDAYTHDSHVTPMQGHGRHMNMNRMPMDPYLDRSWSEYKSHA